MSAVILGWGSLVWDPRDLADHIANGNRGQEAWDPGGPILPIEFSRVSGPNSRRYLSLVIDPLNGSPVRTRFARSTRVELEDTVADLRCREGTALRSIGFVDLRSRLSRSRHLSVVESLRSWATENGIHSVVWTDLKPNFGDGDKGGNTPFSPDNALTFLQDLTGNSLMTAREYVLRAPGEVDTPVRRKAVESGWLAGTGTPPSHPPTGA